MACPCRHLACAADGLAVGLAVVAVDLHSLHLLYSLMKDKLSQHEYVAVPFGRWKERRFYGLVLAWQWHTITLTLINTLRAPCLIHKNIHKCVHMAPI